MNNPKITKIASVIIGTVIGILLIIAGFRIFSRVFTRAADLEPRDVVISEITKNTAKISWSTGIETQGVVEYGTTPTATNYFVPEASPTKTHLVELTLLSAATTYYFVIRIGDKKYDNAGVPWTFTTKSEKEVEVTPQVTVIPSPTASSVSPTPIQTIVVPLPSASPTTAFCSEVDCQKIKEKLGQGCTTQDYFRCLKKLTPTSPPL